MRTQISEITEALDQLIGKSFKYKGKKITLERYKVVNNSNIVVFTPSPINLYPSDALLFLTQIGEPLSDEPEPIVRSLPSKVNEVQKEDSNEAVEDTKAQSAELANQREFRMMEPSNDVVTLKNALLEMVKKVSEDKEFVTQGKVICEAVNSFAALQKNEIDMNRLINKFK